MLRNLILLMIMSCFLALTPVLADSIKIIVPKDVFKDYQHFIEGKKVLSISDFSGKGSRRDVVEMVLIQQALYLGGIQEKIEFRIADSYSRIQVELKKGRAAIAANSLWLNDLTLMEKEVYISIPSIEEGEFEAGLYTVDSRQQVLTAKTLEEIQKLTAISSKAWVIDWTTLEQLHLKKLLHTVKWSSMIRMVERGRGDFLLAPFQATEDLSFQGARFRFIPIPNVKLGLLGSRHFAVSKKYPKGKELFEALNQGLQILKERGTIKKAYQQAGFFNARVSHWKKLN